MSLLSPIAPPYDALEWEKKPFNEKSKMVCRAWALQGYGTPLAVYVVYLLKMLLYVAGWWFFCGFSPGMGSLSNISAWWLEPIAFQKAIIWSMMFEILGFGCGSGPLTGRYMPPLGGFLYFLRPGTTKLPLFEGLPLIGGARRTWFDAALYFLTLVSLVRLLVSPVVSFELLLPIVILLPLMGIVDKTLFLVARGEHYWTTAMVFIMASDWIPGAKAVQAALWFWAGFSKLNSHFPAVVCVMTSNSPFTRFEWLRKLMYKNYPEDLNPSRLAVIAHLGILIEFSVPILLVLGQGGTVTMIGLALMVFLHLFILSNVPMGVPLEWNIIAVYGGFFLFGAHANASLLSMSLPVGIFVVIMLIVIPLLGNLIPSAISFLMAMRYYAGNWAYSVWLFKGETFRKLDKLKKSSPWIYDQLAVLYDRKTSVGIVGKVMGFRLMHLHGRALPLLVPKAVKRVEDYEWLDGELVAGLAIGWNFGEGHLHNEQLLRAIQSQCDFKPEELRCIFVESQPLGKSTLAYRIFDASTGLIDAGDVDVRQLKTMQPWLA